MTPPVKETPRSAVMAGRFFPAEPARLAQAVEDALPTLPLAGTAAPCAVISPHAGYRFSGHLAGAALAATASASPRSAVILSPSHRHGFAGLALPSASGYRMPGFDIKIDAAARAALVDAKLAHVEDAAHDQEHGIETQLPFLHHLHPDTEIIPVVIGRATADDVARLVDYLATRSEKPPLFVLSSDLSHFLTLDKARAHDAEAAKLIETGQSHKLTPAHACGSRAIKGFLASRFGQGMRLQRLGMANSHRATGDSSRTVGYGAWGLYDSTAEILAPPLRSAMLTAARQALRSYLAKGRMPEVRVASFAAELQTHAAAFVSLQSAGRLRGCIGSLAAHRPLIADVVENAIKAASQDPRFAPLTAEELDGVTLKIAVLSPARAMRFSSQDDLETQLTPGRDGLILTDGRHRGTFLPMVWDSLETPRAFVDGLKLKAGLPREHWSDTVQVHRFCAESFSEPDGV
ncbi:AmmeMemoRadiSam system protein B [Roseovarius faecimaris]|uniref:AmmeMemoRadiSam system protein B n=1 Tax=Roseovarius faecimaris TaxID=2494550 RepID=A0A6I6ITZ4_9RHOB|nr:AmmeMemoRadiSam system protein B [Roseovarius faecimaris]QGX99662.1 AmmeMemoRadiSam system protein B [Roseovarius faecimaris]